MPCWSKGGADADVHSNGSCRGSGNSWTCSELAPEKGQGGRDRSSIGRASRLLLGGRGRVGEVTRAAWQPQRHLCHCIVRLPRRTSGSAGGTHIRSHSQ